MAPPPPQGNQQDSSFNILWGVAGVFAVLGVIWYALKTQIVQLYLLIKLYEVDFLGSFFYPDYFHTLHNIILGQLQSPNSVQFNVLLEIGATVGNWFRVPFALLLLLLGVIVYFANSTRVFRSIYSMRSLAKVE